LGVLRRKRPLSPVDRRAAWRTDDSSMPDALAPRRTPNVALVDIGRSPSGRGVPCGTASDLASPPSALRRSDEYGAGNADDDHHRARDPPHSWTLVRCTVALCGCTRLGSLRLRRDCRVHGDNAGTPSSERRGRHRGSPVAPLEARPEGRSSVLEDRSREARLSLPGHADVQAARDGDGLLPEGERADCGAGLV
jgi:hypothetical protein